jgi:metal-responsive CopG/Arc/MetJ family transcriptional regulator
MPVLTVGNTVYTHPVAKVMISIPDEVLDRIDAHARQSRETRSGFLRRLAEREIDGSDAERRKHFEELLAAATAPRGGESARLIREDRESH